jgi:iron complex outermembrane recepter protein
MADSLACRLGRLNRWFPATIAGVVGAAALGASSPALAQGETAESAGLEEVTVTARFRSENLQETPLAITAVTGEVLEQRNLATVTDLDNFVPNTVIAPLGAGWGSTAAAFIRGIGLGDNSLSFEPGVPIYIDDVYHGRPQGALLDLLDLERVEVLRGPQGTLFGKNAIGGTVRLISKKPMGDNSGTIEATVGRFNRLDVRGSYDVSLIDDKLFARIAASSKNRDGYFSILDYECVNGAGSLGTGGAGLPGSPIGDIPGIPLGGGLGPQDSRARDCKVGSLGDEKVATGRIALRWLANESNELNITADYTKENNAGPADKYTLIDPNIVMPVGSGANSGFSGLWNQLVAVPIFGVPYDDRFVTDSIYTAYHRFGPDPLFGRDVENVRILDHWGVSATWETKLAANMAFKSVTAYRSFKNTFGRDSDGSPLPLDTTWDTSVHKQFTQEIQLTGLAFNDKLDWATGAFYYDAHDTNQGWNFLYPLFFGPANHYDDQNTKNWAVFLHGTYKLTDKLSVTGGARYTDDDKDATIFRQNMIDLSIIVPNTQVVVQDEQVSPKLGFNYQWNPDLMTYIQWSTGFRGGGFGPRPANQFQVAPFETEKLKTYEIGMKSDLLENRLRFNAAAFHSKYTNQQQFIQDIDQIGQFWFRTTNTGSSRLWGVELELLAQPVDALTVEATVGYLNYLREDPGQTTLCRRLPNGDACPAPRAPEWNGAVGATYTFGLSNGSSLAFRGDVMYTDDIFFSPDDPNFGFQEAYTTVNSRIQWVSPDKAWSAALLVTNLTGEEYFNGKLSLVALLQREQGNPAAPREWGFQIKRSF